MCNGLRYLSKSGAPWRWIPHDLPPWIIVYPQTRRWLVERSFAWASRFRRLARDDERLPSMLAGLHFAAFARLMLHQFIHTLSP